METLSSFIIVPLANPSPSPPECLCKNNVPQSSLLITDMRFWCGRTAGWVKKIIYLQWRSFTNHWHRVKSSCTIMTSSHCCICIVLVLISIPEMKQYFEICSIIQTNWLVGLTYADKVKRNIYIEKCRSPPKNATYSVFSCLKFMLIQNF